MHDRCGDPGSLPIGTKLLVSISLFVIIFIAAFDSDAVDGIVPLIQKQFEVNDAQTALLRTSSSATHIIALGWVSIFGDSISRRTLFIASTTLWVAFSVLSILLGSDTFAVFVGFRALAAATSAAYGVLLQVMLAEMFRDRALGVALMVLTACEMLSGTASGIINSWIISSALPWQSALLAGPLLVIPPLIVLFFTTRRFGGAKQISKLHHVFASALGLFKIKSFVIVTLIMSLGMFFVRSMLFWSPSMMLTAWESFPEVFGGLSYTTVVTIGSSISLIATLAGLPSVLWFAQSWNHGAGPFRGRQPYNRAYPIVAGLGCLFFSASYIIKLFLVDKNYVAYLALMTVMSVGTAAEMSLKQQILMAVVPARSHAAAVALSRLLSGIISAPSAQLTGLISDAIRGDSTLAEDRFQAYRWGLLFASIFSLAAAILYPMLVWFYPDDKRRAEEKDGEGDENTSLIGETKHRAESILEAVARSRATTFTGFV